MRMAMSRFLFICRREFELMTLPLRNDPLVQWEFEEIRAAIDLDRQVNKNVGWKSLYQKKGNLKRLRIILAIAFFSQWSGNGLVSYYLKKVLDGIGITNPTTQLLINGLLQIWNMFVAVVASFFCDRIGRRILFLSSCAGMCVFFSCQTACAGVFANTGDNVAAYAVIVFIFLYYGAYEYVIHPISFWRFAHIGNLQHSIQPPHRVIYH